MRMNFRPIMSTIFSLLFVMAGVGVAVQAAAQPPARPAVSMSRQPQFFKAVQAVDVNEDGRLDLVGSTSSGDLQVALGAGDGTFASARSLGLQAHLLGFGDLNNDGHVDLIVEPLSILPGRGDGTFGAPRSVDATLAWSDDPEIVDRAVVADFNGDGRMDIATFDYTAVYIYPGRGDYTFDTRLGLSSPDGPNSIVAFDFNNDGRKDLAASTVSGTVDLFLNHGGLIFTASSLTVAFGTHDLAAGDFNGDGRQDLAVAVTQGNSTGFSQGSFHVALGNGDGTFQTPVAHPTNVRGAIRIAVGDFNHDGRADVATGNRSTINIDTDCTGWVYWDSVSIAPGAGNGTFGAVASFRLGSSNWLDERYQNTIQGLVAADVNGDGWTDLLTSPATILFSRAAAANRVPSVGAGPDQTIESGNTIRFDAAALDADYDWLDFQWRDPSGRALYAFDDVPGVPLFCSQPDPGTYTVTVSDRRGGSAAGSFDVYPPSSTDTSIYLQGPGWAGTLFTASPYTIEWSSRNLTGLASFRVLSSADNGRTWSVVPGCASLPATATSCVWSAPGPVTDNGLLQVEAFNSAGVRLGFDASGPFRIVAGRSTALPSGWTQADVGSVGAIGSATFDGGTFAVKGSGSDIWGTADEFHWAFTFTSGDFDLVARVVGVENINQWTKAGLMLRESVDARAVHASLFVTPTTVKGIAFQRRTVTGGASTSTAGPARTTPVWLRLSRAGNVVTAYYRTSPSATWTLVGTETFPALAYNLQAGLTVSSHVHGTLATATFDGVQVIPPDTHLPPGWSEEDIGAVGASGSAEATRSTARVTGSGADIWGTADEFHWAYRLASGDFSIETEVDSLENVNRWTKAGLMIRADSGAGAQHASVFATPTTEKGVAFQARRVAGGQSIQVGSAPIAAAPSGWLRLTRQGTLIRAYFRTAQTEPWRNLGQVDPSRPARHGQGRPGGVEPRRRHARYRAVLAPDHRTDPAMDDGADWRGCRVQLRQRNVLQRAESRRGHLGHVRCLHLCLHAVDRRRRDHGADQFRRPGGPVDESRGDVQGVAGARLAPRVHVVLRVQGDGGPVPGHDRWGERERRNLPEELAGRIRSRLLDPDVPAGGYLHRLLLDRRGDLAADRPGGRADAADDLRRPGRDQPQPFRRRLGVIRRCDGEAGRIRSDAGAAGTVSRPAGRWRAATSADNGPRWSPCC